MFFQAMFSFCTPVSDFPMESWSCCHGGRCQTQISRLEKKLEISFQKSRNTSFQTNVLAENHLNIWTKVSVWKPRWHNSALCHPGPQLQKVSDPGFVPMCSSLYSPVGFVIFPVSFIFLSFSQYLFLWYICKNPLRVHICVFSGL